MKTIPTRTFKKLYHIGSLNVSDKRNNSFEGSGLSVSLHPEEWRKIGRGIISGHTWICTKPNNKFIDAHKTDIKSIQDWGLRNKYVTLSNIFVISRYDDELDDTYELTFSTRKEAEKEADDDDTIIERKESIIATQKLMKRTKTSYSTGLVDDLLLTVFAEDFGYDGVWWQDKLNVAAYSAPRGVIVPSKVIEWSFEKTSLMESSPRTLYHGTLVKNLPDILDHGLLPQSGEFTRTSYDELSDDEFPDLVFAADKDTLYKCVSAIISQMRLSNITVTFENFLKHGVIVSFKQDKNFKQHDDEYPHPSTVEPEDYYSENGVLISGVYTRKKMMMLLKRNGITSILDRKLTEAPISDFGAYGDLDTEGSMRPEDLRAIKNPKWTEKVFKAFSRTPFNFNVYLYNAPKGLLKLDYRNIDTRDLDNLYGYAGIRKATDIENIIGKRIPNSSNSISVLLSHNEGNERIPLTPWMLAHRIVHAIGYAGSLMSTNKDKVLANKIHNFIELIETLIGELEYYWIPEKSQIMKAIAKFKSAQNENLSNNMEFTVECITQYLINGKLTFNRLDLGERKRNWSQDQEFIKLQSVYDSKKLLLIARSNTAANHYHMAAAKRDFIQEMMSIDEKQSIDHYAKIFDYLHEKGLLERYWKTKGDITDEIIERYEILLNENIKDIFNYCIGKVFIL